MKKLSRSLVPTALLLSAALAGSTDASAAQAVPEPLPEWSVLVYMNAKNNLEPDAFPNWKQMADTGSSNQLKIAVELGRIGNSNEAGGWTGVKRFVVAKDMTADAANAVQDPAQAVHNTDMGSIDTFREFLAWGKQYHPAKHYLVVVWNHGMGWRAKMRWSPTTRSVSYDEETRNALYNVDVANAIHQVFGDDKVDIAGFDACLMANVENAYELRSRARYLVGSEELEPGAGWDYGFLGDLAANPAMSADDLSRLIVAHYQRYYTAHPSGHVTLSAVDLAHVNSIIDNLNKTVKSISANTQTERALLASPFERSGAPVSAQSPFNSTAAAREARVPLQYYSDSGTGAVDLFAWLDNLVANKQTDPATASAARLARASLHLAVIANYRANCRGKANTCGDNGLSIYFPKNSFDYKLANDASGYDVSNAFKPVAFVKDTGWPKFLNDVFGIPLKLGRDPGIAHKPGNIGALPRTSAGDPA
ncbi:clostripain-related cysteine peptidase [Burkholderia stagnalis]